MQKYFNNAEMNSRANTLGGKLSGHNHARDGLKPESRQYFKERGEKLITEYQQAWKTVLDAMKFFQAGFRLNKPLMQRFKLTEQDLNSDPLVFDTKVGLAYEEVAKGMESMSTESVALAKLYVSTPGYKEYSEAEVRWFILPPKIQTAW